MSIEAYILPLDSPAATLEIVGGKGTNLSRLRRSGYPVPPGFLITTRAYRDYLTANGLDGWIQSQVDHLQADQLTALEATSAVIRARFSQATFPEGLAADIRASYQQLLEEQDHSPVAVRSSATAEDLPDLSFAGQQDTFLNVVSEAALFEAVVNCWSSLWTARAIGYRARNGISQAEVALAVVVQEMVPSEAAGVMFTANPLNGLRTETVIDATLGLGEALVSGQVEPDHYVVDASRGEILEKILGAKALAIHADSQGGVVSSSMQAAQIQALPDGQILALARLGQRLDAEYAFPQDIEWAWAQGKLYLLQSRAITSLFPIPADLEPEPLHVLFSFGAVQGMLEPMTPLGQDAILLAFMGGAKWLGYPRTLETLGALHSAGERLWVDISVLLRNTVGRRVFRGLIGFIEPSVGQALNQLWDDPRLQPERGGMRLDTMRHMGRAVLWVLGNVLRNWRDPEGRRAQIQERAEREIQASRERVVYDGDEAERLVRRVAALGHLVEVVPQFLPEFLSGIAAAMAPLNLLDHLLPGENAGNGEGSFSPLVLELTRGAPHNVTTEMDLRLWETARAIRSDPISLEYFQSHEPELLAADFQKGQLPAPAQEALGLFLERYGDRGVGEIDLGQPRWRENPLHILQVLDSYLRIRDESLAPDVVFQRGQVAAQAANERMIVTARRLPGGWLRSRLVGWAARRVRAWIGMRESPKFFVVRMMGLIRRTLLESGMDLVQAGLLERPDDLFFLRYGELEALALEWQRSRDIDPESAAARRTLISERRAACQREKRRNQVPRLLLSDGRAFYEGLQAPEGIDAETLVGSPVSPGAVEGLVRVVFDPQGARLEPGEILVCPGTDPAWTPLFLAAGGLVMEVGGMMTHGSVVAREYGIPAVVGVHQATSRLRTGQRVRVDGSQGKIVILEAS